MTSDYQEHRKRERERVTAGASVNIHYSEKALGNWEKQRETKTRWKRNVDDITNAGPDVSTSRGMVENVTRSGCKMSLLRKLTFIKAVAYHTGYLVCSGWRKNSEGNGHKDQKAQEYRESELGNGVEGLNEADSSYGQMLVDARVHSKATAIIKVYYCICYYFIVIRIIIVIILKACYFQGRLFKNILPSYCLDL